MTDITSSGRSIALSGFMDSVLKFIFRQLVSTGTLEVVTARGKHLVFGDGTGLPVRIRFMDWRAEIAFVTDPDLRVGELFVDQRIVVEQGTIYDFLTAVLREKRVPFLPVITTLLTRYRYLSLRFLQDNGLLRARKNVAHHYDLDDRLYELFLDKDRQYSCAYFETPAATLDEAQLAKKRHIAAKLLLKPGERVLDIGCGWGGMALYLNRVAGAGHVTGVTLSAEQLGVAKRRALEAGVPDAVDFQLMDYREIDETFERIVSVGMFEHVGITYYDAFFTKVAELLTDDGVMLLHTIGSSDVPSFTNPWIVKYIFPGGHIPSLSDIVKSAERSRLVITDVEVAAPPLCEHAPALAQPVHGAAR